MHLLLMISVASPAASILISQGNVPGCWDLTNCTVELLQLPQRGFRPGPLRTARQFLGTAQESAHTADHFQIICSMEPLACRVREFNNMVIFQLFTAARIILACLSYWYRYSHCVLFLACRPSCAFHFFSLLSDLYVCFRLVLFI